MSAIDQVILDAVDRLTADPYFTNIPVIGEKGQIVAGEMCYEDLLGDGLNRKGLVVGFPLPSANHELKNLPVPMPELEFKAEVWYQPFFLPYSGRPTLNDVCEHVSAAFWLWTPMDLGAVTVPMAPSYDITDKNGLLMGRLKLHTVVATTYDVPLIAPVIATMSGSNVVLTCATASVQIFYTVNGGFPNGQSNLYAAPFAGTTGQVIKARAYRPGYRPPAVKSFIVP